MISIAHTLEASEGSPNLCLSDFYAITRGWGSCAVRIDDVNYLLMNLMSTQRFIHRHGG